MLMELNNMCNVCGDFAKHYHYNQLVCLACRAFFRRMTGNINKKELKCIENGLCTINKKNRRNCVYCRYKKCKEIGMTKEKCLDTLRTQKHNKAAGIFHLRNIYYEEIRLIVSLLAFKHKQGLTALSADMTKMHQLQKKIQTAVIYQTLIDCHYSFLHSIWPVSSFPENERRSLTNYHFLEAFNIVNSLIFDPYRNCWDLNSNSAIFKLRLNVRVSSVDHNDLFGVIITEKRLKFMHSLRKTNADEIMLILLSLVSFFSITRDDCNAVFWGAFESLRNHYNDLLLLYLNKKCGPLNFERVRAELESQLCKVRKLSRLMHCWRWQLTDDQQIQKMEFMSKLAKEQSLPENRPIDQLLVNYAEQCQPRSEDEYYSGNKTTKEQTDQSIKFSIDFILKKN